MIIAEWQLTPDDEAQIAGLLRRSFTTDFGGRSFFQQRPHLRLITREQGRIIGHMAVMLRAVRVADRLVDVAGLADVATDPDRRGLGIAQALLAQAIAAVRGMQAEYFLLFGTAGIYRGNGFIPSHNPITYVDLRGARTGQIKTERAQELMVLPLRDRDWPVSAPVDLMGGLF